jgi:hypothetical protein
MELIAKTEPAAPTANPGIAVVISDLRGIIGASLRAAALTVAGHTVLLGTLIVLVAYWAAVGGSWWRGIAAAATVCTIHGFIAPLVLLGASLMASASTVIRMGVARRILAAAADRAVAIDPRVAETTDLIVFSRALSLAFDELVATADAAAAGARFKRLGRRISARVIRTVARVTLYQLDILPREDGLPPYRTLHEWLGSRIDGVVASTLRDPAWRLLALALGGQAILTTGVIFAARSLPGWSAAVP